MKKLFPILMMLILFSMGVKSQNPVLNLSNYLRNGMLDKAYENLNLAMADDKYTSDAKTWLLRGNLYYATFRCYDFVSGIYIGMPDSTLRLLKGEPLTDFKKQKTPDGKANKWEWDLGFSVLILNSKVYSYDEPVAGFYKTIAASAETALELARESYLKTIELDPRFMGEQTFPSNAYQGLSILSEGYFNLGVLDYNASRFKGAFDNFRASHEIKTKIGMREARDTIPRYYAVKAASYYIRQLSDSSQFDKAIEIAGIARGLNPDDVDLSLSEADAYLKKKDYLKTKALLEDIIQKQPNNANLYFVIGNIYDQLSKEGTETTEHNQENFDLCVKYYRQAVEVKPDYFEALFNLGTMYNNKAVDKLAIAQKLPFGDPSYNGIIKEVDELFNTALPFLEKAHQVNSTDPDPMRMLYSIYLRQKKNDQAAEMKKKMDAATKKE
jgi:tetratricopeptide (TPR) repeat protein